MTLSRRDILLGALAAVPSLAAAREAALSGTVPAPAAQAWRLPEPRPVTSIENTWIPLRDGTRLACRLWLPEGAETTPVPVVWEYLPYRLRDRLRVRDEATAQLLAPYGVAFARVDIRGSGNSEGVLIDEYDTPELKDGVEVIAWLAKQPWSNGSVGMRGISWGGINSLQTAAQQPPALKAIMPMGFVNNRFDDDAHYVGGCLEYENYRWGCGFKQVMAEPPDPAIVGPEWQKQWQQRLDATPPILETWTSHQRFDSYWQRNTIALDYGRIKCPVYAVSGWLDPYSKAVGTLLANLKVPRKGLIGPWGHLFPNLPTPIALAWAQEEVRWWHHWLKGIDTGIMDEPMFRAYMPYRTQSEDAEMPGRWVAERSWPPPATQLQTLHLNAGGQLSATAAAKEKIRYVADKVVGIGKSHWMPAQIGEQTADDQRSLVFDSAPLDTDLEILGYPVAKIRVSANVHVAHVAVRLNEVLPTGESWLVAYGILNLAHRHSLEHPVALQPGEIYDVQVSLYPTAHRFKKGSRIRAAISESLWPLVWPSPRIATLEFELGVSSLVLPVRPIPAEEAPFTIPVIHAPAPQQSGLNQTGPDANGKITLGADRPARAAPPNEETGTVLTNGGSEYYEIVEGNPNSSLWRQQNIAGFKRDEWDCTVTSGFELTSTPDEFHLKEYLRAHKGETQVFEREKLSKIRRNLI